MNLRLYSEGKAKIFVPDYENIYNAEVFFNPRARTSRDISALIMKVLRPRQLLDAMAATGIRGIRYAVESGVEEIVFNDINPKAVELAKRNAALNNVEGEFLEEDVNILCHSRRFLAVDLDPFGTPSPFLQSVARCIPHRGYALITATDTSPLTGSSPLAAIRKYHVRIRKVEWFRELAVRVLLGYVAHHFAIWEKAFIPVASFFQEHHLRVIGRVVKKASEVTRAVKNIDIFGELGPLWKGPLHDRKILERAIEFWDRDYSKQSLAFLKLASKEIDAMGYHNLHSLSKELKISPPPLNVVIEKLRKMGYEASRSSLDPLGIKTTAPRDVLKEVLRR